MPPMQLTPSVTFRGVARTDALDAEVQSRIEKLATYYPDIVGCRVLIELIERHHEAGNRYHVRINVTVAGEELVVSHEAGLDHTASVDGQGGLSKSDEVDPAHKHAVVALHEAFDVARRQLQDYARRRRARGGRRT